MTIENHNCGEWCLSDANSVLHFQTFSFDFLRNIFFYFAKYKDLPKGFRLRLVFVNLADAHVVNITYNTATTAVCDFCDCWFLSHGLYKTIRQI